MTTAKQNQKFPFHFFFRFAAEGWGEETREKCKEIFWFLHTRVRGALYRFPTQSGRTGRFRATTRVARAISRQNPADFSRSTFELRPIHTAFGRRSDLRRTKSAVVAKETYIKLRQCPQEVREGGSIMLYHQMKNNMHYVYILQCHDGETI
jgi:hypothetical protein